MQVDDCASVKVHNLNLAVILSVQAFALCNMNIFETVNFVGNQMIWKLVLIKRRTLGQRMMMVIMIQILCHACNDFSAVLYVSAHHIMSKR